MLHKLLMNKSYMNLKKYFLPIFIILALSLSRLIPHPWNFTPMIAVSIFSGFYFRQFFIASFIVILPMFIGDLYLGFHSTMIFVYLIVAIGFFIKSFKFKEILFSGLISSLCFFLITNFGAWLTLSMYEKNFAGLINSYVLAIPFFHNTLLSTFIYLFLMKVIIDISLKRKISLI